MSKEQINIFNKLRKHNETIASFICGLFLLLGWLLYTVVHAAGILFFVLAFIIGGFVKAREGLHTLINEREIDVNLLMIIAAIGAASIGYWLEGGLLIFIFATSGALETYAMAKSERDLFSLLKLRPEMAILYHESGHEVLMRIEEILIDELIVIKPGERIPLDGVVAQGTSYVDQSPITGEYLAIEKQVGDQVFAGALNGVGSLIVRVTKRSKDTVFAKIIQLVADAKQKVPKQQQFIERFEKIYAKTVLVVTFFLIIIPPFIMSWPWSESVYRAMIFLVVASPCALVASIMPALLSAISNGARQGVLFKNGMQLVALPQVRVVAFDKTGTLTEGKPQVTGWYTSTHVSFKELFTVAGSLEILSEHPLGKAIVNKARELECKLDTPKHFTSVTGWGVEATYNGQQWKIGKPAMFTALTDELLAKVKEAELAGQTVVMVGNDNEISGFISLQDTMRIKAQKTVAKLKELGLHTVMLTGDQKNIADEMGKEAGINTVYSELLPSDKVSIIEDLQKIYGPVAMIGDGVNDAPALALAHVGIAMGGAGNDTALETADIVLMNDDLDKIPQLLSIGKRTKQVIYQNISFSLSIIALLILANFAQMMTLPIGVIGHEGSTILVILNGLRLLRG